MPWVTVLVEPEGVRGSAGDEDPLGAGRARRHDRGQAEVPGPQDRHRVSRLDRGRPADGDGERLPDREFVGWEIVRERLDPRMTPHRAPFSAARASMRPTISCPGIDG